MQDYQLDASRRTIEDYLDAGHRSHIKRGKIAAEDLVDILKSQLLISDNIKSLSNELVEGQVDIEKLRDLVRRTNNETDKLHAYIVSTFRGDPLAAAPTTLSSKKANRVFNIHELAEMILSSISPEDLLSVAQVNKGLNSAIENSTKLKHRLGLEPDPQSFWTSNFDRRRRSRWSLITCEAIMDNQEEVKVTSCIQLHTTNPTKDNFVVRIGSRVRSMLICQPPILEMTAHADCCGYLNGRNMHGRYQNLPAPPELLVVRSSTGLTVGDLLDAARKVRDDHCLCPYAREHDHDPDTGFVDVGIKFRGWLKLRAGDPLLSVAPTLAADEQVPRYMFNIRDLDKQEKSEMGWYIEAKQYALRCVGSMPTFEEFRASSLRSKQLDEISRQNRRAMSLASEHEYGDEEGNHSYLSSLEALFA